MLPTYFIEPDPVPGNEQQVVVFVKYGFAPRTECGKFSTAAEARAWTAEQRRLKGYDK